MTSKNMLRIMLAVLLVATMILPMTPATLAYQTPPTLQVLEDTASQAEASSYNTQPQASLNFGKGSGVEPFIDWRLRDEQWIQGFVEKYGSLLEKTYTNTFGVKNVESPIGVFIKPVEGKTGLAERLVERLGGEVVKCYPMIGWLLAVFPADRVSAAVEELGNVGFVKAVVLDDIAKPAMFDVPPLFGMYNIWYNLGLDGSGVLVSVIDTGVDPNHPAIPDPLYWRDFINGQTTPYDDHGHGTHVAGIILGRGDSVFTSADAMWHSLLVGESAVNPVPLDYANLTYQVDVTGYDGQDVVISLTHFYNLYENLSAYGYYFKANASVLVKFDTTSWTTVATFKGNATAPLTTDITVTVPTGATTMQVQFRYDYLLQLNGSYVDFSEWDITGWFIDSVSVYLASDPTVVFLSDPVTDTVVPSSVVNWTGWVRVEDQFRGMAPGADLAAAKVCGASGCPDSAILEAMNWSLSIGADIVSMSLGGTASTYDPLAEMADYLVENGVVVVIAAGNEGPYYFNVSSPGISHKAITVAAASKSYGLARFSSPGPSPVDLYLKPDVAAIGWDLVSSITSAAAAAPPWAGDFPYVAWAGTSMATPMVSGLAALILQAHPDWTPEMVKSAIISTADWLLPNLYMGYEYDVYKQGAGMIDPLQAVTTELIPEEANMYLGYYPEKYAPTITATINITNLGGTDKTLTVVSLDLYLLNTTETYSGNVTSYTSLITSPALGDTFTIPAGSVQSITLEINGSSLPRGIYGGHIAFQDDAGNVIKVIFGLNIYKPIIINGTVTDYLAGSPLENVNVTAVNDATGEILFTALSGPDGSYTLAIPSDVNIRITAELDGYVTYLSYPFRPTANVTLNITLVPMDAVTPGLIVVDVLADVNDALLQSIESVQQAALAMLGQELVVWKAYTPEMGSPAFAILTGPRFIAYLAGGSFYPLTDRYDSAAMLYYVDNVEGSILLSAGDLGWSHGNDTVMVKVAHAYYIDDKSPDNYTVSVYNHTATATLFGPDTFLASLGSPPGTVIGELPVTEVTGWYPDDVRPANNGVGLAVWNDTGEYAMIAYYGNGTEKAKTLFLAFELGNLPAWAQAAITERAIALAYDMGPPFMGGPIIGEIIGETLYLHTSYEGSGIIDEYPFLYVAKIRPVGEAAFEETFTSTTSTIEVPLAGFTEGETYRVNLTVYDILAQRLDVVNAYTFMIIAGGEGYTVTLPAPDTVDLDVATGVTLQVDSTGLVNIQVLQVNLENLPPLPAGVPAIEALTVPLDVYLSPTTAANATSITLTVKAPAGAGLKHLDKTIILWHNGTSWVPVSHYTYDEEAGTITITINATTSPSLTDLTGTPIILVFPPALVGGQLLPATTTPPQAPTLAVATTGAAIIASIGALSVARRRA